MCPQQSHAQPSLALGWIKTIQFVVFLGYLALAFRDYSLRIAPSAEGKLQQTMDVPERVFAGAQAPSPRTFFVAHLRKWLPNVRDDTDRGGVISWLQAEALR